MRWATIGLAALVLGGTSGAFAESVGVASAVDQSAMGRLGSAGPKTLTIGDKVIHNEKIETNDKGLLQILLADGTSFTVGPNSSMTIDSFVYDPSANTAKVVATLGTGVFRFIGGRTSKADAGVTLNSPVGVIGIRGGISDLDFSKGKPHHIDMLFGDSITLSDHGSVIGKIVESGYSIVFSGGSGASVVKTPPGWIAAFQHQVQALGGGHTGSAAPAASTKVAEAFKPSSPSTPAPIVQGTTASPGTVTTVADISNDPPPVSPQGGGGGVVGDGTLWSQIYASSLANTYATYEGRWALSATEENLPGNFVGGTAAGDFSLAYHFGTANGNGTLTLQPPDVQDPPSYGGSPGSPLVIPVTPVSGDVDAAAHFGASMAYPTYFNPTPMGDPVEIDAAIKVAGSFSDVGGTGHGVSGTIDYHVDYPTFTGPDDNVYSNGQADISGTFSGGLSGP